jgi:alpha-glucosidase
MTHKHIQVDEISSPTNTCQLRVEIIDSIIWYSLRKADGSYLVSPSQLAIYSDKNLATAEKGVTFTKAAFDETWEQPWGEQRYVRNNYHELALEADDFAVRFRLFDDGLGLRYELKGEGELSIASEESTFNIDNNAQAWWIPALGQNHYEHLYQKTSLPDIDTAHTPLTLELSDGTYASIHEAALYDYGAMNLIYADGVLKSRITPRLDGSAALVTLPFTSPWRTIIFADTPHELGLSRVMLNLNEPSRIEDTSWIVPMKFLGIWWMMFIGYATWATGEKHGATTGNAFRYINAAKDLGISGLLIEGWNDGWGGDWTKNGDKMNHMQPTADFDIHAVTKYAASKGIDIVGHHETSGNISHYEWELPEAYDYYKTYGVRYIKTGYVAPRLNTGDYHSSQIGVNHYQKTVELAAERRIMLDIHEPVKGTGLERTWPNILNREGVMGQEYEGGAVSPEHATVLPFTRSLAGPLDYTPGLFNLSGTNRKVHSTLAKQLAFYVTMYSPMQMVADLPEHYAGVDAFQFIRDVPVNWEVMKPLAGEIGNYYVVARKDRQSDDWYIGGVADEERRDVTISFDFLNQHQSYTATIYKDTDETHWQSNPESYEIETKKVTSHDTINLTMAPGGGVAIRIQLDGENANHYPTV